MFIKYQRKSFLSCLLCLSPPIMFVPNYHDCPHLLCLSPPIMIVPTYYVCPHRLCLSPPIMSVPTYYVCPHLLCLFSPIFTTVGLHLGYSARLKIWQVPARKMEPQSGYIMQLETPTQPNGSVRNQFQLARWSNKVAPNLTYLSF